MYTYYEQKRQAGKREQILGLLRSHPQGITNAELSARASLRYGAHLGKLYELGYKIRKDSLGDGLYLYTLIEEPERENHEVKKALDVLLDEVRKEEIIDASMLAEMLNDLGLAIRYKPNTHNKAV